MPRWLARALRRARALSAAGRLRLTHKAAREALSMGLSPDDVRDVIARLVLRESGGRVASEVTGEWLYLFRPSLEGRTLYVKLLLRQDCVVVSFHEDEGRGHEEDA